MPKHRVLIVEDDSSWQGIFRDTIMELNDVEIEVASSYEEADERLVKMHFHLALIDLRLSKDTEELKGTKLAQKIAELNEGTNTIIVSGYADPTITVKALKRWKASFLIEKGEKFDPGLLRKEVQGALSEASKQYRLRYSSAMDFLRGDQDLHSWASRVLRAILGSDKASTAEDLAHLRDLLNQLLKDLHPLLYHRADKGSIIDNEKGVASARCWSKARGEAVLVRFGKQGVIDRELEEARTRSESLAQRAFTQIERTPTVADLGGIVYVPAYPQFEDFEQLAT